MDSDSGHLFARNGDVRRESVRVAIRLRPLNERERQCGASHVWTVKNRQIIERSDEPNSQHSYAFDHVFDERQSTEMLYQTVAAPVVNASMQGINGTVFAYGQTSSGKTHTMMGSRESPGVIPFALSDIFQFIHEHGNREFLLRVSHLEIYNEVIRDLLSPDNTNLKIHENTDGNVFVGRLTEENVRSPAEVMTLLCNGQANRQTASTNMNDESSRSHSIFRLTIESRERQVEGQSVDQVDGGVQIAALNLVDLAGSERVATTGSTGMRLKEGGHINKSLLTLGKCIRLLSEGDNCKHIPFRDSKLTRILSPALGGNSSTVIICAITPASLHVDETISTISFACRAKTIQNVVKKNEIVDEQTQIRRLQKEISALKSRVRRSDESDDLRLQCEDKTRQLEAAQAQSEKLRKLFINANNLDLNTGTALSTDQSTNDLKRSAARRRRTVDPAAFSAPTLQLWAPQRRVRAGNTGLDAIDEMPEAYTDSESISKKSTLSIANERDAALAALEIAEHQLRLCTPSADHINSDTIESERLREENQTLRDRCASAETNLEMVSLESKRLSEQCETWRERLLSERKITVIGQAELKQCIDKLSQKSEEVGTIQAQLEKAVDDLKALQIANDQLKKCVDASSNDASSKQLELQEAVRKSEQERSTLLAKLDSEVNSRKEHESRLECAQQLSRELTETVAVLQSEKDIISSELSSLKASTSNAADQEAIISMLENENAVLNENLKEANNKFSQVMGMSGSKQEQFFRSAVERNLKQSEKQVEKLQLRVQTLEEAGRQANRDAIEFRNQRTAHEKTVKALERQLGTKDKDLASARAAIIPINALQKQMKAAEAALETATAQYEQGLETNADLTQQLKEYQNKMLGAEQELQSALRRLNSATEELATVQSNCAGITKDLETMTKVQQETQSELRSCQEKATSLMKELETRGEQLRASESIRNEAEENAMQAHFKLEEVSLQVDERLKAQEQSCQDLNSRLVQLQNQYDSLLVEHDNLSAILEKENTLHREVLLRETAAQREVSRLRNLFEQADAALKSCQQDLAAVSEDCRKQSLLAESSQARVDRLNEDGSGLHTRVAELTVECSRLNEDLENALQTISDLQSKNSSADCKISTLQTKLQTVMRDNEHLQEEVVKVDLQSSSKNQESVKELEKRRQSLDLAINERVAQLAQLDKKHDKMMVALVKTMRNYAAKKEKENRAAEPQLK